MSSPATIGRILHKEGIEKAHSIMKKGHEEYRVTLHLHAFYSDEERSFLHVYHNIWTPYARTNIYKSSVWIIIVRGI